MALTRDFKELVQKRIARDPALRGACEQRSAPPPRRAAQPRPVLQTADDAEEEARTRLATAKREP
jgi:hypothetical protein